MKLWTIQPAAAVEILEAKGAFTCEILKSEYFTEEGFIRVYEWMVCMMDAKGILRPREEVNYPLWAWHTRDWKHKKLDLRCSGLGKKGEKMVCVEFEISDSQVLLSDFHL